MFNTDEQAIIQRAKDLEADAKSLRKTAEEQRKARLERTRIDQSKIDKEDFDDRVRLLISKFSRELKSLDLKVVPSAGNSYYSTQICLKDNKSNNTTTVKVTQSGFNWN